VCHEINYLAYIVHDITRNLLSTLATNYNIKQLRDMAKFKPDKVRNLGDLSKRITSFGTLGLWHSMFTMEDINAQRSLQNGHSACSSLATNVDFVA
jgi:hypothetical protein